jgi:alkylresorcinol/alkylpyrone synthase
MEIPMFLHSLGTALPARRFSKAECWDAFRTSEWFGRLDARSHAVTKLVLTRDNGIDQRWLCMESLDEVFAIDPDTLHQRFVHHAPRLAGGAGLVALQRADLDPQVIDAVIVTTCTGYLCPGLSGYVVEQLGLRNDVLAFDLVGQGCAGALPNWQLADALLASGRCEHVLSICVEVCSAAMYLSNDPGVLISACLFGDGAGAAILSRHPVRDRRRVEWTDTASFIDPAERAALRFEHDAGMLRNILTRKVPTLAAHHARKVLGAVLERARLTQDDITGWIFHAGGRDVLTALESALGLQPEQLRYSRDALRLYGNLSSAFVYFVLTAALDDGARGGRWWMSSFGAGFTCHGALLSVE